MSTHRDGNSGHNTVRDDQHAGNGTVRDIPSAIDRDNQVGDADGTHHSLLRLPQALASRFQIVEPIPTGGSEADLLVVENREHEKYVAKLYRTNIRPKSDVLEAVSKGSPEHVIKLFEHGQSEGIWYELLEYAQLGSLRSLLQGSPVSDILAREIIAELAMAIAHLHKIGIIHRDLKPENILIRTREPLDLILTDFGIASLAVGSVHYTSSSRTVRYGAPESASGVIDASVDYWALGMILVEALTGQHPFEGLSEPVINNRLNTRPVDISNVPANWRRLCAGLLVRDPKNRWCADQLEQWLAGARGIPVSEDVQNNPATPSFPFEGERYRDLHSLVLAFAQHWDAAIKAVERGNLSVWLQKDIRDFETFNAIEDIRNDKNLDKDERLFSLISRYCPELPPVWKGRPLTRGNLAEMAAPSDQNFLQEVFRRRLLSKRDALTGGNEYTALEQAWSTLVDEIQSTWAVIARLHGPSQKKPDTAALVAAGLLGVTNPTFVDQVRIGAERWIQDGARQCSWLSSLGDSTADFLVINVVGQDAAAEVERIRENETAEQARIAEQGRSGRNRSLGKIAGWALAGIFALWLAVEVGSRFNAHSPVNSAAVNPAPTPAPAREWTAAIVWKAPGGADAAIKGCNDWTCFYSVLEQYGAPSETVDFLRAEQQLAPTNDLGYPVAFQGSGKVKSVEIFDPGLGQTGMTDFVFVNGPGGIVHPNYDINQVTGSAVFQSFQSIYPQAEPWDSLGYKLEMVFGDGSQQFQFTQVVLNGCHACAVLGSLTLGFDFDRDGRYTGVSVLGIDPEKDAAYGALSDDLSQKSQYFQTVDLTTADGNVVSAPTQTIVSPTSDPSPARCRFSVSTNPNMTSGWFMLDEKFDLSAVTAARSSELGQAGVLGNSLTIACNNSASCISPVYSDQRGVQAAVASVTFLVPPENVAQVLADVQKLQSMCGDDSEAGSAGTGAGHSNSASSATSGVPPEVVVAPGECPFEGCQYGRWTARENIAIYQTPSGALPRGIIGRGDVVQALTGEIRAYPQKMTVVSVGSWDGKQGISTGDVVYALFPLGEGAVAVWQGGEIKRGSSDLSFQDPNYGRALRWTWWAQLQLGDGSTVWVRNPQGLFSGMDKFG